MFRIILFSGSLMTGQWVPLTQLEWFTSILLCSLVNWVTLPTGGVLFSPLSLKVFVSWAWSLSACPRPNERRGLWHLSRPWGPACFSAPVFGQPPLFLRACRSFRVYSTFQCQRLITAAWSSRWRSRSLLPFLSFFDEKHSVQTFPLHGSWLAFC